MIKYIFLLLPLFLISCDKEEFNNKLTELESLSYAQGCKDAFYAILETNPNFNDEEKMKATNACIKAGEKFAKDLNEKTH